MHLKWLETTEYFLTYTVIPSCSHFLCHSSWNTVEQSKSAKKSNAMKSFYFNCNIRVAALINVVCLDWKAQIKVSMLFFFFFFLSKSSPPFQKMKKQHAPRSLGIMTELLPCCISSVTKSLCSPWVGLRYVYTSIARWQLMIHNTQSFDKANKQRYNMVWSNRGDITPHMCYSCT